MSSRTHRFKTVLFGLVAAATLFAAFTTPAQAQGNEPTRWEFFGGYSWLDPRSEINNPGTLPLPVRQFGSIEKGYTVSGAYFFNRWVGVKLDTSGHFSDNANIGNVAIGPTFRWNMEGVNLFAHGLIGWNRFNPVNLDHSDGVSVTGGVGMDLDLHPNFSWRVIQFDWMHAHHNFGRNEFGSITTNVQGPRLSSGIVFKFGTFEPPVPPSASCTAAPQEVWAGEPVRVTATTANFNPKRTLSYQWSATGGQVEGTNQEVTVNTNGLNPGSYTVTGRVSDGKKGMAECTASFRIRQPQPPTITCTANPTTVQAGDQATVTCQGASPDNRNLTYSHQASAGQITPNGANASVNSTGAQPGPITITSQVSDDRNLTASTTTTVTVEAPPPPPPPAPESSKINTINFKQNNARVDNAAKAILDDVALRLQRDADAKLVIVGGTELPAEKRNARLAGQRAANAREYLTKEKGIDPSRIEIRSGGQGTIADMWIVPAGATFNAEGTQVVTETAPTRRRR